MLEILRAEGLAQEEADKLYPISDFSRVLTSNMKINLDFRRVLSDRYRLRVAQQRNDFQLPAHTELRVEGVEKGWF